MSTLSQQFDLQEQICYVQCGFCTIILLVSVPSSSLTKVVTVRCGHCTSLLSVNMMKASFLPLHLFASLGQEKERKEEVSPEDADAAKTLDLDEQSPSAVASSETKEEDVFSLSSVVNKPPEKRQRAPSAYNHFIKKEIKRLKKENPAMSHKEAFSTAAKNWAHFPSMQFKGVEEEENYDQERSLPVRVSV